MIKAAAFAIALLTMTPGPALAGPCDADLPALKAQLASATLQPDVKSQVQDMVAQAEKLCAAGNEEEAADVLSDASSMLSQ